MSEQRVAGDHRSIAGRFEGRSVIVTGAGSGIGLATTLRLATEGASVVAVDVSAQRLDALVEQHSSLDLVPVTADITRGTDVIRIVDAAAGRVDGLANVAGVMDAFLPPAEVDDTTWERVLAVNVTGPMRLTRAVLPIMEAVGHGAIVNASSEASLRASVSGAAYATSKHALNGLTRSTTMFGKDRGIRANAVAIGAVRTNIEAPMPSATSRHVLGALMPTIVPEPVDPSEPAAAICWLLSDDASYVNGAVIPVDGGWSVV